MNIYNFLKPIKTTTKAKRKGRGIGSGQGKTAGKGHKGQRARSGKYNLKVRGFGSQTSMARFLPKRGFNSHVTKNLTLKFSTLLYMFDNKILNSNEVISTESLYSIGLLKKNQNAKVIFDGLKEFDGKLSFSGIIFSKSLKDLLVSSGSTIL